MGRLTLTSEQDYAVKRMAGEPTRAALNASTLGTGKTLMAVELAIALGAETVLVTAPLGTHKGWKATFERQGFSHPVKFIKSDNDEFTNLKAGVPGAYLVGREFFYLSATSSKLKEDNTRTRNARWSWSKIPRIDLHVVDESHSVQNQFGKMFMTLRKMHNVGFKLGLSGTPQGSKFDGIWAPTKWLWPDHVDGSKIRWAAEWATQEQVVVGRDEDAADGLKRVTRITGEKKPGAYLASLPCVLRLEYETKPYELYEGRVDLSPTQRKMWDEMFHYSIAWLPDGVAVADLPVTQRIRLRQMALGEVSFDPDDDSLVFAPDCVSTKLDAALKIQARHPGQPILFVTDSARFARVAAPRLGAELIIGDVPKKVRDQRVDTFGDPGGPQYIVATYQAIAEGTDGLQRNCNIEVLFNPADSPVLNEQFNGRLNRMGQRADKIIRYSLVARNTLDDEHFDIAAAKMQARRSEVDKVRVEL